MLVVHAVEHVVHFFALVVIDFQHQFVDAGFGAPCQVEAYEGRIKRARIGEAHFFAIEPGALGVHLFGFQANALGHGFDRKGVFQINRMVRALAQQPIGNGHHRQRASI